MQTDFLIIGQGLAGSLLAWELMARGCRVVVVDNGDNNASKVAAGIINPVTGMRLVKTEDVETLLPAALKLYAQLSTNFGQAFYIPKPLIRLFRDQDELSYCKKRQRLPDYAPYLGELSSVGTHTGGFAAPFGFVLQHQTGHLLTLPLLSKIRQFCLDRDAYRTSEVAYEAIQASDSKVTYNDLSAQQVIFCEGHNACNNPWFSWLPFQPAKGEILTLAHQLELPDAIINYGNWLLPSTDNKVRVGATFDRERINTLPTAEGKQALLAVLKPYNPSLAQSAVCDHQAGVRPCTADRQPFIGKHPLKHRIAIFNGFGAKGSLQIPWYSQRFAELLLYNKPLPAACDIQRYTSSHFAG